MVYVPLFSSFGSNPQGLVDSLASFAVWTQTGAETQVQPIYRYIEWMARPEVHILVLGIAGGLIAAWRGRDRLDVFFGLWALGITLAYSLITYKTPWIAVNMIVPLAIVGGIAVREIVLTVRSERLRWIGAAGFVGLVAISAYQATDLSFTHYDDETYGYVTVHTTRDVYGLIDETNAVAGRAGEDLNGIVFVSSDYWPLPWYYRDNPKAGFFGQIVDTNEAVIVANVNQDAEVAARFGDGYVRTTQYQLRPGVDLAVWVRADLAGG
jgi:predicted membrane-bound mannosyltransferase